MKKERFEAITDAILAIIITLMVLEIKIPDLTLVNILPVFQLIVIYAVSFIYIAILWLNHHHIFINTEKVSLNLVWLNFGLLFSTSLLPLATEHLSSDVHNKANHIFFGSIMATITFFYSLIQQIVLKEVNDNKSHMINLRNWIAVGFFTLSIPLCLISEYISGVIFIFFPMMYFLISRKVKI